MDVYAEVTDGVVTNVVVCDSPKHAAAQGWRNITRLKTRPGPGWAYDGKRWTPPVAAEVIPDRRVELVEKVTNASTFEDLRAVLLDTLHAL